MVAAARRDATGRIGLQATPGGFGTPTFGEDVSVRIDGTDLVVESAGTARREPISTLGAAAAFVGVELGDSLAEHDSPALGEIDRMLAVDDAIGAFMAAWFAFGTAVLAELAASTDAGDDTSGITLWPGHLDPALETGNLDAGRRATYGASPGDANHPEPYLYVGAWGEVADEPYWNATGFNGALLPYTELRSAADPFAAAVDFLREGHRRLTQS